MKLARFTKLTVFSESLWEIDRLKRINEMVKIMIKKKSAVLKNNRWMRNNEKKIYWKKK